LNMASSLGTYLQKLSTDPQALSAFRNDQEGELKKAGLSQEEVSAIKSKDPAKIKQALGAGAQPADIGIIILIL
jgi:hypothetical protein